MSRRDSRSLDFQIPIAGPLSAATRALGYERFAKVAEAVRALPYGRVRDREESMAVLQERKGTCSSKHRFLAALAHECGRVDIVLTLGLYEMSEKNTPGVGRVLAPVGLDAILEAHCYLTYNERRFDFTGLTSGLSSPFESLLEEQAISPHNLASTKTSYHREAMSRWAASRKLDPELAWQIREECIRLLANHTVDADARKSGARGSP
jgi:hypothetical protein